MTYNDLHISNIASNKYITAKLFLLGLFSAIIIKITRKRWFRTGTFKRLARAFDSINADCLKVLKAIRKGKVTKQEAVESYNEAEKILRKFITIHSIMEKDKFFGNEQVQHSVERALRNLFKVESQLKAIVTEENNCVEHDAPLFDIASDISLGYLQA